MNSIVGPERVFMDVEDIAPGQLFARKIDETIATCDIALIVIGPRWADILRERAQREQLDYVRHEIETALANQITVVPVLVGGASIAELTGLPEHLSALCQYEAAELRDATFSEDCARLATSLKLKPMAVSAAPNPGANRSLKAGVGAAVAAVLVVVAAGWMGIGPLGQYRARRAAVAGLFATAKTQEDRSEYESAFRTYELLLKTDPENRNALERQADAAMSWLDDFHVIAPDEGDPSNSAGKRLDEIKPVLDAAMASPNEPVPRAADILAHIGWWHWLNRDLAHREFGPAAEQTLRKALQMDPSNVFANAMLGNWLMQTGGDESEALVHFQRADESKRARRILRSLELGVLVYPRDSRTRVALIRLADEMRRNGESVDDRARSRMLNAYDPTVNTAEELSETLSAIPADNSWATYRWLEAGITEGVSFRPQHDFIQASIMELQHHQDDALKTFQKLRVELQRRGYDGRIVTYVDNAIKRLSSR
jgi:tetratricopeptide (TPR) repeat protein